VNYIIVLQNKLQAMARVAVAALPSVVIAILVLAAAWLLARFAANIVGRLTGRTRLRTNLRELLESLVKVAIWVVGFLLAATIVVPGFTFGGMVAGLGIGAVAIGFAFQDIFKNFLAGVLIMLREKMHIGDSVECGKINGTVEHISLRETHIRQATGELNIVPNSMLFENAVRIVTDRPLRRDEIVFAVDFDCDLEAARDAVKQALGKVGAIDGSQPQEVFAQGIDSGARALELVVRWWTDAKANNMAEVRSEVIFAIAHALGEAGVELPVSTTELITREDFAEAAE
jgi:small conductance mechanosensitive channel